jgi:hypothetical protein
MFAVFVEAAAAAIGAGKRSAGERGGDNWTMTRLESRFVGWLASSSRCSRLAPSLFLCWALPCGGERNIWPHRSWESVVVLMICCGARRDAKRRDRSGVLVTSRRPGGKGVHTGRGGWRERAPWVRVTWFWRGAYASVRVPKTICKLSTGRAYDVKKELQHSLCYVLESLPSAMRREGSVPHAWGRCCCGSRETVRWAGDRVHATCAPLRLLFSSK